MEDVQPINKNNETELEGKNKNLADIIALKKKWLSLKKFLPRFFNFKAFNICLIVGFGVMFAYYLSLSNVLISKGFAINELREESAELTKINTNLELEVMRLESFATINNKIADLGMVGANDIEYIEVVDEAVALR